MNKQILKLALPNILSHITVPLLGIIDMSIMGHLEKPEYLSAVSLGNEAISFLFWNFAFLRMSTAGITAQNFGAKRNNEIILTLVRAMLMVLAASLLIIILKEPLSWLIFDKVIPANEGTEALATSYFSIRTWAAPAALGKYVLFGWFIGMQNSIIPMIVEVSVNIINIGLNFLFVYGLGMTSDGVALATVISQYLGFISCIIFFMIRYRHYLNYFDKKMLFTINEIRKFFDVNKNIFIRTFLVISVLTYYVIVSSKESNTVLNVNSILRQFIFMFSFFIDGFAVAGEALVGKYYGARDRKNLKKCIIYIFSWGFGIALIFTIVYAIFGKHIIEVFTNKPEEILLARKYLIWFIFIPIISFTTFVWDGVFIGTTATKYMLYSVAVASLIVFFPLQVGLEKVMGNQALFLAISGFFLFRGLMQTIWAKKALAFK